MLAHGIQVDQRPAVRVPEQVVPLEVAMADALADQFGEQVVEGQQFVFRRIALFNVRRKTLDDVRPRQVLGDQVGPAAQPEKTLFQDRQRLGGGDAEECQARLGRQKRLSQWAKPLML